jgi:glutathione S-transferase
MADPELTLYAESSFLSPWVFHAFVALEEKHLPYKLEVYSMPLSDEQRTRLKKHAILGKVPTLQHGELWITESLAISEYAAERFPFPSFPRLFPADLGDRARSRQVMSYLRTSMFGLREDRPTSGVFGRPTLKPLSDKAKADAAELLHLATTLVKPGATSMFGEYCIADSDLALALMRMIAAEDPMPSHLVDYALAQFDRRSVKRYVAHLPTSP